MSVFEQLQVGDHVKIENHGFLRGMSGLLTTTGEIIAVDKYGNKLFKSDDDLKTYDFCIFNNYKSDKRDLLTITPSNCTLTKLN